MANTILLTAILLVMAVNGWFLLRLRQNLDKLHRRIDQLFSVDLPSQNQATADGERGVEINEQNMLNFPPNVRIELEDGGDDRPLK